jgi:glycosyltransferase involved in cell wall biosynthesis
MPAWSRSRVPPNNKNRKNLRLLIVSDAWYPQVNGVVRSLATMQKILTARGHTVTVIGPSDFKTVPMPTYAEIRLALFPGRKLKRLIEEARPDAIHIATEGPLGWAARKHCRALGWSFTTSYHTRFPEYVAERFPVPLGLMYRLMRRFHGRSDAVMVATPSIEESLRSWGFDKIVRWGRGVDTALFHPRDKALFAHLPRPVSLYVGRVAVEKNIEAFLKLDLPGSKVVVGGGPQLDQLKAAYPAVHFTGPKQGEELAAHYAAGDVFVFPSRTDTFGLVLLEALASGVPVAAYPVPGPIDVLDGDGVEVSCLDEDLARAVRVALEKSPEACRAFALRHSWEASADQFFQNLYPFR